jgi:S1-C subfamily serine protease
LALTASCFADGSGSGFIVRKEGYVVTNHHVIEDAKEIWVKVPGKTIDFRASVVIDDSVHDLTLLKIQDSSNTVFDALQISGSERPVEAGDAGPLLMKIFKSLGNNPRVSRSSIFWSQLHYGLHPSETP